MDGDMQDSTQTIPQQTAPTAPTAPVAPAVPLAAGGMGSSLWMIVGVVIAIVVIGGGVYVYMGSGSHSANSPNNGLPSSTTVVQSAGSNSTTTVASNSGLASTTIGASTTITAQSINSTFANATAELAALDQNCNIAGVTKITATYSNRPRTNQTYIIANGNVTQSISYNSGQKPVVTNFTGPLEGYGNLVLEGLCAVSGGSSIWVSAAQANGGNLAGKWFSFTSNGITGEYNVNASSPNYISLESRIPGITINGTSFQDTMVTKIVVLKKTRSMSGLASFYLPGTNPMIQTPFQTLMNNENSTANLKIEYNMMVAESPGVAKMYGNFSDYESMNTNYETSSFGWENYTYTFG